MEGKKRKERPLKNVPDKFEDGMRIKGTRN
jgi:hypothetical protein